MEKFEREELIRSCPRKVDEDQVIYTSKPLVPRLYSYGVPVLGDFGEARFGQYNRLGIQPFQYQAPEVILEIHWDEKMDIWNVGVMVSNVCGCLPVRPL